MLQGGKYKITRFEMESILDRIRTYREYWRDHVVMMYHNLITNKQYCTCHEVEELLKDQISNKKIFESWNRLGV